MKPSRFFERVVGGSRAAGTFLRRFFALPHAKNSHFMALAFHKPRSRGVKELSTLQFFC